MIGSHLAVSSHTTVSQLRHESTHGSKLWNSGLSRAPSLVHVCSAAGPRVMLDVVSLMKLVRTFFWSHCFGHLSFHAIFYVLVFSVNAVTMMT